MSAIATKSISCNRCGRQYPDDREQQERCQPHETIRAQASQAGWKITQCHGEAITDICWKCLDKGFEE